jgi:molecular chaperone GrpE
MTDPTAANNNAAAAAENATPRDAAEPAAVTAAVAQEAADYKDRLLRSLADMENLRRRTEREVADARAYGIAGFARDLVGVADNMRRALEAAGDGAAKALVDGIELTERVLLKVLEKHGVKKFEPQGAKFETDLLEGVMED